MDMFAKYDINSGMGLKSFVEAAGLEIFHASGLGNSQNIVELNDLTTFNWKSRDSIVRVNCKENAMHIIESMTQLTHIDNGVGDSVRRYSFIISSFADLIDAIYALKTIEGNCIRQ